ncbi:Lactoylglutathione lyase [Orbilia oligospora]|uniref:lactoylglutathione lyase n=1 Tax=Orbilia oligospora TaxID=2813651 RepID=A0A7C8NBT0_ORBOL|nr:Lactoylglutathione lyase [Orbilia oligospora]KAF3099121.1 Lactoylglutathione lyase [Orbilia oligospora]KAF3101925.1 Lactoylglutathione lyase [Orbilia oligospora]KAF3126748.1 Lactoylglutathione lyase [Orbilia oligospora]KAF3149825.1 Lactoylglutathione lyase [Orbilia oligospora]
MLIPRIFTRRLNCFIPPSASRTLPLRYQFRTMATDTSRYKLNHTMLRVKDPVESVKFYELLGMKVINKIPNPQWSFDLYFLAYDSPKAESAGNHWTDREGIVELTHNYGTESNPEYTINNGNDEPHRGFGHICISVDNLQNACDRLEEAGVAFKKKLSEGRMRHIAFAKDPNGYWVEIIGLKDQVITPTDVGTYRMNHSMIRVKSGTESIKFYTEVMGMTLLRTHKSPEAKFDLYFLGYKREGEVENESLTSDREGLLELTYNYGTDDPDSTFAGYHDGNSEPQGFGHICVTVDDLDAACERFEGLNVNWKKRLTDGKMKDVAFIKDPDGYWIEVVQNEGIKKRADW